MMAVFFCSIDVRLYGLRRMDNEASITKSWHGLD
jgi:hypothetical protein